MLGPLLIYADDFSTLVNYMTSSFSSAKQAISDSDYYYIRLEMVRIWPDQEDGVWLYVEQAVATHLDRPYRQRIYHLPHVGENEFESAIFTFAEPLHYAGLWKTPQKFEKLLSPADLIERQGCSVFLTKQSDGSFTGSTNKRDCIGAHRGAGYTTSKVTIEADKLVSWDIGFDANGNHMWGAEKDGYIFDKLKRNSK